MPPISSNCSGPAISGGESWITGSPRSSARQISPRLNSSPERKPRSSALGLLARRTTPSSRGPSPARSPGSSPRRARRRRSGCRAATRASPRKAGSLARTLSRMPSRSKTSRLASATAAAIGCPPNVMPCMNVLRALRERLDDAVRDDHGAHRGVGARDALRRRDDVRLVAVALGAEVLAEAAPASRSPRRR